MSTPLIILGISVLAIMCLVAVLAGILLKLEHSWYVQAPKTSKVSNMTKFEESTLFPYSGSPYLEETAQTEAQCISICNDDADCHGFYRHNDNASTVNQGDCYFYDGGAADTLVGSGVNIDPYFLSTDLIVGAQLHTDKTDVYIKPDISIQAFRSDYDPPKVV